MKYELAKKLKDAGYPQRDWKEEDGYFLARENGDSKEGEYDCLNDRTMLLKYFSDEYLKDMHDRGLIVYIPTLSELIEACGKVFWHLTCSVGYNQWHAESSDNGTEKSGYGLTPEEAVALLWLELQKQK